MKIICAALFACCCVASPWSVRAVELSLGNALGTSAILAENEHSGSESFVDSAPGSFSVDRHEDDADFLAGLPTLPVLSDAATGVATPLVDASPTAGWVKTNAVQKISLDATRPRARVLASTATTMPLSVARNSGVPDSVVFLALAGLVLGLLWACSGWIGRLPSLKSSEGRYVGRSRRSTRVRMIPLDVER